MRQRTASVSLDVDNLWSYMKVHGDPGWTERPSYLDIFVPYVLEVLEDLDLKITFFIVGADAAETKNHGALGQLVSSGHEVGNHSFEHEPWLHRYTEPQLEQELADAHDAIVFATGAQPIGFRGPGFSWSPTLLDLLERRGYAYDASTLPTYLGPLARLYYFWTADLSPAEREERKDLFGHFADGLRPVKPYYWSLDGDRKLMEIPVTTIPGIKTPFHFSYLLYLARFSERLMMAYLRVAIGACRMSGAEPSFLLHPLDIIGSDQVAELSFFPGMDVPGQRKTKLLKQVLRTLAEHFELVTMSEHAKRIAARGGLPSKRPA